MIRHVHGEVDRANQLNRPHRARQATEAPLMLTQKLTTHGSGEVGSARSNTCAWIARGTSTPPASLDRAPAARDRSAMDRPVWTRLLNMIASHHCNKDFGKFWKKTVTSINIAKDLLR
ncbi:unnamed protein product [Euphydryas editha]|uniref:Uncharacterized protein n=1 Tax=Euphydryas editha TaxID=104508 RepID=A0AAU9VD87_EUPED|nr:unnamed protein product [Euphydryas editha]